MGSWTRNPYRVGIFVFAVLLALLRLLASQGVFSSHASSSGQPSYSGKVTGFRGLPARLRVGQTVSTSITVRSTGATADAVVALSDAQYWKVRWTQVPDPGSIQAVSDSYDPSAKAWDLGPVTSDDTVIKLTLTALRPGTPHLFANVYGNTTPEGAVDLFSGIGGASWNGQIVSPAVDRAWRRLGVRPVDVDLYAPNAVALDPQGRILVADGGNDGVVQFSPGGRVLARWSPAMGFAWGVAAGPGGTTYVNGRGEVFKLNAAGRQVAEYNFASDFDDFNGIAVAPSGRIYLPEANNGGGVVVLNRKGQEIATWGDGSKGYQISAPGQLGLDGAGNLYVPDAKTRTIAKVSPSGRLLGRMGGNGALRDPKAVALDGGNLYVAETGPARIVKLAPSGRVLGRWGSPGYGPGQLDGPSGIAVDRSGRIYVADSGNNRIVVLSPAWKPVAVWGW